MNEYLDANRSLWNEWTAINVDSAFYDLESFKAGGIRLRDYELEEVGDVAGKRLLHLQCHFGIDTLSWARVGARPTGVDFSQEAIARARSLAAELGLDAEFLECSIDALPDVLNDEFDVVYTSRGVLGWLPDLRPWAEVVAHFVKPGGIFYITEAHPVLFTLDDDEGVDDLVVRYPYFGRDEPLGFPVTGSYADTTAHVRQPVQWCWPHSMGEIITALAEAGLHIDFLHEFPFAEWPVPFLDAGVDGKWHFKPHQRGELPMFFSLRARRH
jgi:SAM-dependent methyltransferase